MSPVFSEADRRIDMDEFRRRLLECLEAVEADRISLVVFRYGKPYAKLVPWDQANPEVTSRNPVSEET